ncbi:MAG: [LysW]-lysine hydrolase [Phycisphaerales bacterium]
MTTMSPSRTPRPAPNALDAFDDQNAIELVHDLVATASVSGAERAAAHLFAERAARLGFTTEIDHVGSAIATRGSTSDDAVEIVMLGHIDTVPGVIPVRIEGDTLHGRGSVDAKGPLATHLIAAARANLPENVRIRVVAAVGEETADSTGANAVAPRLRPDACIVAEPSAADAVTLGYKGRLLVERHVAREAHHSAGPDPSAADDLLAWWNAVHARLEMLNDGRESPFEILQHSVLDLSHDSDGVTDRARLLAGFRLPDWITPELLEQELHSIDPAADVRVTGRERAHRVERNDPVVRALTASIRASGATPRHKLKTGTADLNVVAPVWNCPIAAYGPGDSTLDHTPEERLELPEYLLAIRVLTGAIERLAQELLARRA